MIKLNNNMKKIALAFMVITIASCGNNNTNKAEKNETSSTAIESDEDISNVAIFKVTDCATCHKRSETFVGPSFTDIAVRYANATDTAIDDLASSIINGSSGKWKGSVAMMIPHTSISRATATEMVKYILQIKK